MKAETYSRLSVRQASRVKVLRTFVLLAPLAGCASEPGSSATTTPAPPGYESWHVVANTAFDNKWRVGSDSVRLLGVLTATLDARSQIVLGNSSAGQVIILGVDGRLRAVKGRVGSGPGEYRSINWMVARDDSIILFDLLGSRYSVLDSGANVGRQFLAPIQGMPIGRTATGEIVVAADGAFDPRRAKGVVRDSLTIARAHETLASIDTIMTLPGAEWIAYRTSSAFRTTQLPYGAKTFVVIAESLLVTRDTHQAAFVVHALDGRNVGSFEVNGLERRSALTTRDVEDALSEMSDAQDRRVLRDHFLRTMRTRNAPTIVDLRSDDEGNLWIRPFTHAGVDSVRWLVVRTDGTPKGSIVLPVSMKVLSIRAKRLVVTDLDVDGDEVVSLLELRR